MNNSINRQILRLSIPNIVSNITIPLLGMVDMAIVGSLGSETFIGAMAVGTSIFNFIYWNFSFLRMGTGGFTAQAYGARDMREMAANLVRSLTVALCIAALILILQYPIGELMLMLMGGSETVQHYASQYLYARIWAAPATLSLYVLHGWFIGMQNSKLPMFIAIAVNLLNILFSLLFVFELQMGFVGVAWGTVVAQYGGLTLAAIMWWRYYRRMIRHIDWRYSLRLPEMMRFFSVNRDIFIRTICVCVVYTFFTSASAEMGDLLLAVNTLLMQLFTLYSYVMDGFAYSAESLIGRFEGAKNQAAIRRYLRYLFVWGALIAIVYVLVFVLFWQPLISIFTDSAEVISTAREYLIWIVIVPIITFIPFLIDGALIGATKNVIMRNTVSISTVLFFICYYALLPTFGNDALWTAFIVFMIARGLTQYIALRPLGWF